MYTVNSPIFGLSEDLDDFLGDFVRVGSPRFSDFAELWRKNKFIELVYGRQTQSSLKDNLEGIFFYLVQNFMDTSDLLKIGSLYVIYAFYGKQPVAKQARVNVTPRIWNALSTFMKNTAKDSQWDAYYIFHRLCVQSAFRFVANAEELYPGVPLYTRSKISLPTRRTFLTKVQRKLLTIANKEKSMKLNQSEVVPVQFYEFSEHLKTTWNAILMAVKQYIESKNQVNKISGAPSSKDSITDIAKDNLLWSLNLVTYQESIAPICNLLEQLSCRNSTGAIVTDSDGKMKTNHDDIGKRRRQLRNANNWSAATRRSPR